MNKRNKKKDIFNIDNINSKEIKRTIKQFTKIAHFDNKNMPFYIQHWFFKMKLDEYFDMYVLLMDNKNDIYWYDDLDIYRSKNYDVLYESEYYYSLPNKIESPKLVYKNTFVKQFKKHDIAGIIFIPKNIDKIINNNEFITVINAHMDKIESISILKSEIKPKDSIEHENKKYKEKIIKVFKYKNGCKIALYDDFKLQRIDGKPIGGDDRCGITIMLKLLSKAKKYEEIRKHIYVFTNYEERGLLGVKNIQKLLNKNNSEIDDKNNELKELIGIINKIKNNISFIIGLDRKGFRHYVNYFYKVNSELSKLLKIYYNLNEERGSVSDVKVLSEIFDSDHINLSVGFYNAHFSDEYVKISDLMHAYYIVFDILLDKKNKILSKKYKAEEPSYISYPSLSRSHYQNTNKIEKSIYELEKIFNPSDINRRLFAIRDKIKIYRVINNKNDKILRYIITIKNNNYNNKNNVYVMKEKLNLYTNMNNIKLQENIENNKIKEIKISSEKEHYVYNYIINTFDKIDDEFICYKENEIHYYDLINDYNYGIDFENLLEALSDNIIYTNAKLLLFNFMMLRIINYLTYKNNTTKYQLINSEIFNENIANLIASIIKNKNIVLDIEIKINDLNMVKYNIDKNNKILILPSTQRNYFSSMYAVDCILKFKYL